MSVSAVSAQVSQVTSLVSSLNTSNVSTSVTSNVSTSVTSSDPTVLARQAQQLSNQIMQLQGKNGSSQQIQKLQQAVQTIKNKIQQQRQLAEEKKASTRPSNAQALSNQNTPARNTFTKGIDVKA